MNTAMNQGGVQTSRRNQFRFSGHETFAFRYPWIAKGVSSVEMDSQIFSQDSAIIELGVGRNMVSSIRYWCEALRLIRLKGPGLVPTELGRRLVVGNVQQLKSDEPKGWDPYLEDVGTLWLLHYLLVSCGGSAATWHLLFTHFGMDRFRRAELLEWLEQQARKLEARVSRSSLERDFQVFLRTYLPSRNSRGSFSEDSFDCPLVELGLLNEVEAEVYTFSRSPKRSLPAGVFHFALLDYWSSVAMERESMPFERLLYEPGSPGAAFKLSEREMVERLEMLPSQLRLEYRETAGTRVVYGRPPLDEESRLQILGRHYEQLQGGAHD